MTTQTAVLEEICHFVKDYAIDHYSLQLILFFAKHPCTRFNELAIIHALTQNGGRSSMQKALRGLVEKSVVKACFDGNLLLYSLSSDTSLRSLVLELAKLDVYQRRFLPAV